ncbi:MAG: protein phosphatase 2C domain-containing protein [Burkholderiaceae bacterium]|jgi:protein phosphatase|nr:protein phosphatase 2C domain-containing protein [Burkholderiaceae bacterium]
MRFSVYQESRKGGRQVNQDRMGYLYTRKSLLMMVADGMGGHARGEVAAEATLQTLATIFQRDARPALADPAAFLEQSIQAAHRDLHRYRAENRLPEAPRTTVVACVVQEGVATWAHVGDSRLYLLRGGRILHRTLDHSRVHHLVASGLIRPEDVKSHPERNRIHNCVGAFVAPRVEIARQVALRPGDTVLLCSDGLWGALSDADIVAAFGRLTVMRAVPELMGRAMGDGGPEPDNCTAIAMSWAGTEAMDMIPPTDSPVSTLVIPEGSVASTVQMPRPGDPSGDEPLTEDQIDDAVAEIQRAIQRSGRLIQGR